MAVVAGTYQTDQVSDIREDLQDKIYDISPLEVPTISMAQEFKAKDVFHEWLTDTLAAPAANRQIEGDQSSYTTPTPAVRVGNYCQILRKTVSVSGTLSAVNAVGKADHLAHEVMKQGREIRRDLEYAICRNQASSAGSGSVARSSAGLESWLTTFVAATGSSGSPATPGFSSGTVASPTDSTAQGTFIEADLKSTIQACWSVGGQPSVIMCGPHSKQKISGFAGNATKTLNWPDAKMPGIVNAAVDIYVSDFGRMKVIANRWQRDRTVFFLDPDFLGVAYLRRMQLEKLGKKGDAEERLLVMEACLVVQNEAAHAKLTDVVTTDSV